jgi:hypothetical protein
MKITKFICGAILVSSSAFASASNYGCTVLMCLSNPAGPTAVAACIPPITQLWKDLLKFKPFPSCDEAGDSFASHGTSYYDPCPEGLTALPTGERAALGNASEVYLGIGSGDNLSPSNGDEPTPMPGKTCVQNKVGQFTVHTGPSGDWENYEVGVYNHIANLSPVVSPNFIDVTVANKFYKRIRW